MKFFYLLLRILFQVYAVFVLTWYNPFSFSIIDSSIKINLDFILIYFVFQSFFFSRVGLVFLGCFIGYLLDLDLVTHDQLKKMKSECYTMRKEDPIGRKRSNNGAGWQSVDGVNGSSLKIGSMNEVNTNGNWPKNYSKDN